MFSFLKGGQVYPPPPLLTSVAPSCEISGCVQLLAGGPFEYPCDGFGSLI